MLHEEVDLKWEELQAWVQDFQLLEKLRSDLIIGVSVYLFSFTNWKKLLHYCMSNCNKNLCIALI